MGGSVPRRVVVAGAGIFGLCAALGALRAGASVTVFDPDDGETSASSVAAGMIAPLGEILLDGFNPDLWPLFRESRDLWTAVAREAPGVEVRRGGLRVDRSRSDPALCDRIGALRRQGAVIEVRRLGAGLEIFSPEDWTLDAPAALIALRRSASVRGAVFERRAVTWAEAPGDALFVAAAGAGASALGLPEALMPPLSPIKGHILRFPEVLEDGPVRRGEGAYVAPQPSGLIGGATMEHGVADLRVDPERVAALRSAVLTVRPDLAGARFEARVGVRSGGPDGLPYVGPAGGGAVFLALGARRNGWLFGPLVGRMLQAYLTGRAFDEAWLRFDPDRRSSSVGDAA